MKKRRTTMRMKEKTTAILLIAIFMMSTLGIIVSASSDYYFTQSGTATAGLIDGGRTPDGRCVEFWVEGGTLDDGKIRFYHTGTLGDFEQFSYWSYVTGNSGELHPYVVLDVDKDNDTTADMWVVQWEVSSYPPTGENTWIQTTFDNSSLIHVYGGPTGYGQPASKTLEDLKNETGYSDYKVLQAKLMFGYFSTSLPNMTALVDDITINSKTWDFDPPPPPRPDRRGMVLFEGGYNMATMWMVPNKLIAIFTDDVPYTGSYELTVSVGEGEFTYEKTLILNPSYKYVAIYLPAWYFPEDYTVTVQTELAPLPYVVASAQYGVERNYNP